MTAILWAGSAMAQASKAQARQARGEKKWSREARPPSNPAIPDKPAVAAILETKPTTPEERIRAAKMLADLNRADLAKGLIAKVLDAKLDPQQLADLGQQVGSPVLLDLSDRPALAPEAKQLADAIAAALTARLKDTNRITAADRTITRSVAGKTSPGARRLAGIARRRHRSAVSCAGRSGPRRRTCQRACRA